LPRSFLADNKADCLNWVKCFETLSKKGPRQTKATDETLLQFQSPLLHKGFSHADEDSLPTVNRLTSRSETDTSANSSTGYDFEAKRLLETEAANNSQLHSPVNDVHEK
jgi:hypothetical protein